MKRVPGWFYYVKDDFGSDRLSDPALSSYYRLKKHACLYADDQYSLPDDDQILAKILRKPIEQWLEIRAELFLPDYELFKQKNGRIFCPLQREAIAKCRKFSKSQSEKGKRSGEVRGNQGSTTVQPGFNHSSHPVEPPTSSSSSSPTPTSSFPKKEREREKDSERSPSRSADAEGKNGNENGHGQQQDHHVRAYWFSRLLESYPRKKGVHQARQLWFTMADLDKPLAIRIIDGAKRYADSRDWKKNGVAPNLDVWLAKKRWDDRPDRAHY